MVNVSCISSTLYTYKKPPDLGLCLELCQHITTRKVEYPESGVAHFSATPENRIDQASIRSWTGPESIGGALCMFISCFRPGQGYT